MISSGDINGCKYRPDQRQTRDVDSSPEVPERLRELLSRVLDKDNQQQVWLQKSTRTKIKAEARRLSLPIMAEFAEILQRPGGCLQSGHAGQP